ncbi:hypothetical protein BTM29_05525 [Companilactobacillus allii]|uniref:HTH cro/C1-type domain-containing protein n=2 Tax=Companilactobacillus allii TaxID=1847728 RepID=A0A1P8Q2F5_9LACO|nr:hypothetical protein BTM29_05525 [Companilactobacillus allii]
MKQIRLENRMQEIMDAKHLNNHQVEMLSGIHHDTISKLKNQPDKTIQMGVLEKLCNTFQVEPSYFFKEIEIGK